MAASKCSYDIETSIIIFTAIQSTRFCVMEIFTENWLTHFSLVLHFIWKSVIWFLVQIKWLGSIWNATLSWNGLITSHFCFLWRLSSNFVCFLLTDWFFAWDNFFTFNKIFFSVSHNLLLQYSRQSDMFSHSTFIIVYSFQIRVFWNWLAFNELVTQQPLFISLKSTTKISAQIVKYVQSWF